MLLKFFSLHLCFSLQHSYQPAHTYLPYFALTTPYLYYTLLVYSLQHIPILYKFEMIITLLCLLALFCFHTCLHYIYTKITYIFTLHFSTFLPTNFSYCILALHILQPALYIYLPSHVLVQAQRYTKLYCHQSYNINLYIYIYLVFIYTLLPYNKNCYSYLLQNLNLSI